MGFNGNISLGGRWIRISIGVLLIINGVLMIWLDLPGAGLGWRIFQGIILAAGLFTLLEGVLGWCAVRAMGFRTKF